MTSQKQELPDIVVLVVEDEELVRLVALEALTSAGISVVEAHHADKALAILEDRANNIHVMFTDIHMPGQMDGLQLAHHARGHWPWIGLLITSGRARPETINMPDGCRFLPKPYEVERAVKHVWELAALR